MTAEEFREEIEAALKRHSVDTDTDELRGALEDALSAVDAMDEVSL